MKRVLWAVGLVCAIALCGCEKECGVKLDDSENSEENVDAPETPEVNYSIIQYISEDWRKVDISGYTSWYDNEGIECSIVSHECVMGKGTIQFSGVIVSIPTYAFDNSDNLTHITIPEGVKRINHAAFTDCVRLAEVHLPETLEQIFEGAFWKNSIYVRPYITFYCRATIPPLVDSNNFYDGDTFYVPREAFANYQASPDWRDFNINPYDFE